MLSIAKTTHNLFRDSEKLRSNVLRIIGNLFVFLPKEVMEREMNNLISSIVVSISKNMEHGTAKTRWNACHAAMNLFKNNHFLIGKSSDFPSPAYTSTFYISLMSALKNKNFKVRIHACQVLTLAKRRSQFETDSTNVLIQIFKIIYDNLTESLNDQEEDIDFIQYKYKNHLNEQLMNVLVHLTGILSNEDGTEYFVDKGRMILEFLKESHVSLDQKMTSISNLIKIYTVDYQSVPICLFNDYVKYEKEVTDSLFKESKESVMDKEFNV